MTKKIYYKTNYNSPVGKLTLASDGKNLVGLWLDGQKYFAGGISGDMTVNDGIDVFNLTKKWLDSYFSGKNPVISSVPLSPAGSNFRQRVWQILCEIPYGKVATYGEIAALIARENGKNNMSARAIGGAVGHNPISIIIPCHRVIGASGSLIGYAGGIENKIKLLQFEGVDTSKLYSPEKVLCSR